MRKKRNGGLKAAAVILAVLIAGYILVKGPLHDTVQKSTQGVVRSQLVSLVEKATGLNAEQVRDIINVIPEEQQEEILSIAVEHITPSKISHVLELAKDQDSSEIMDFVQEEFSVQEIEELETIAVNNKDSVMEKLSEYGVNADRIAAMLRGAAG